VSDFQTFNVVSDCNKKPNGSLYGTTAYGGPPSYDCNRSGCGTVFNLRPPQTVCKATLCPWTETVLYFFRYDQSTGGLPWLGDLIFDHLGNMFGTTKTSSQQGWGYVFELGSMSTRAEIGQIRFNNTGNSNSQTVPSQIIAMHLRRTDESIEKTYKIYCEVWEKQGHEKTAEFIRAVSSHVIPIITSARKMSVISQLSQERARTGAHIELHNARVERFKRSISRLAARWSRKLEIEARECAHSEKATPRSAHRGQDEREANQPRESESSTTGLTATSATKLPTPHAANVSPNWVGLYEGFAELAREERALSPRVPGLIASVLPDSGPRRCCQMGNTPESIREP